MRHAAGMVLDYVQKVVAGEEATDRELLRRFAERRDESAFAALVERHGPMVLRVCRRTLNDAHEAEDVCQKVFLLLASRTGSRGWHDSIASWLHQTAFHQARRARDAGARRRGWEGRAPSRESESPDGELTARELQAALDEELARLPEKYRAPLVLCYLEGLTRDEAASRLGLPLGTLKSRVERGRELLRERLTSRGMSLSALLLVEGVGPTALPPGLVTSTARAAMSATPASWLGGASRAGLAILLAAGLVAVGLTWPREKPAAEAPRPGIVVGEPLPPGAAARLGADEFQACTGVSLVVPFPDGKTCLSVSYLTHPKGSLVTLWDLATGKAARRFAVAPFRPVGLSADGKTLVGVSEPPRPRGIICHDVPSGRPVAPEVARGVAALVATLAPDGDTLAVAGADGRLRLWSLAARREIRTWEIGKGIWRRLAFSPDGRTLAGADDPWTLRLWNVTDGREIRRRDIRQSIGTLTFSPDGKTLALAPYRDKSIHLLDVATGGNRKLAVETGAASLAFSPDGSKLVSSDWMPTRDGHAVRVWDVKSGHEVRQLTPRVSGAEALAFTRDGGKIITGGGVSGLRLHDAVNGRELLATPTAHGGNVIAVAFSPNGKAVATGDVEGVIRTWDAATGRMLRRFAAPHGGWGVRLAFSPDGRALMSAGLDRVRFRDPATGEQTGPQPAAEALRGRIAYAPGGRLIVSYQAKYKGEERLPSPVRFWDAATREEVAGAPVMVSGTLACPPFSADGTRLFTLDIEPAAKRSVARVWDVASRVELRRWALPELSRCAVSPDGGTLVGGDPLSSAKYSPPGRLHVVNLETGKARAFQLPEDARPYEEGFALEYSPDGRCVAYTASDGACVLWEVASGEVRRRLRGHRSGPQCLAFSPGGTRLVSGGYDAVGIVWDLTATKPGRRPSRMEPRRLWEALAGEAGRADEAIRALTASPAEALPFLKERLKPAATADARQVARLIERLDSERFADREDATRELQRMDESARPALLRFLEGKLSLETRRRLERITAEADATVLPAERLREVRAVEVLERIRAKDVLSSLAKGAAGARLTRDAAAALERLESHTP